MELISAGKQGHSAHVGKPVSAPLEIGANLKEEVKMVREIIGLSAEEVRKTCDQLAKLVARLMEENRRLRAELAGKKPRRTTTPPRAYQFPPKPL